VQQHDDDGGADDLLRDFASNSAATPAAAAAARPLTASSSSPVSLSSRLPSAARTPVPPLHLLLYAPRRGQLELWALPYGGRIGAKNVGLGCVLQQATYTTSAGGRAEVTAHLIRPNGDIQVVDVTAPAAPIAAAPSGPAAVAAAAAAAATSAEETLIHDLECSILDWSRAHECAGYSCSVDAGAFEPLQSQLQELQQCMWRLLPSAAAPGGAADQSEEALLAESHVARLVKQLSESGRRLAQEFVQREEEHEHEAAAQSGGGGAC
jgi:hypothetical protein